jgi:uncharacterized protein YjbJ (UPF0337 family)
MGSTADKASGIANEAVGKAKQGIGSVVVPTGCKPRARLKR